MLNFVAWIVAGGLLGLAITRLAGGHAAADIILNALAGIVAAFLAGLAIQAVLPAAYDAAPLSPAALAAAVGGAGLMLGLVNRRRRAEPAVNPAARDPSDEAGG